MSFSAGTGGWVGRADVFDADGRFAGHGRDTRSVTPHDDGTTTVDVAFDGPFSFAGRYTIASAGDQRRYLGPLNLGVASSVTDDVVESYNHWPDLGLTQRFLLAVTPEGDAQLSLALLARGEALIWVVVGENRRPDAPPPPDTLAGALLAPGVWRGDLPSGPYVEEVAADGATARLLGTPAGDVAVAWEHDDSSLWSTTTDPGSLTGSATLVGGRALSGSFSVPAQGLRVWRREVASADGSRKAVVHHWYRGDEPVGVVTGVVTREAEPRGGPSKLATGDLAIGPQRHGRPTGDASSDRFLGAWLVTEHVFDPATRRHLGDVRQRRTLRRDDDGSLLITQVCEPDASLDGHPMAGFAGEWTFTIEVDGATRHYRGPDVVGTGTEWSPGSLTGAGRWPRFGHDFTSWSVLVGPGRQLTGGTFTDDDGAPVAVIVGVAVEQSAAEGGVAGAAPGSEAAEDAWPALDVAGGPGSYGPMRERPDGIEVRDEATATTVRFVRSGEVTRVIVEADREP